MKNAKMKTTKIENSDQDLSPPPKKKEKKRKEKRLPTQPSKKGDSELRDKKIYIYNNQYWEIRYFLYFLLNSLLLGQVEKKSRSIILL